MSLSQYYSEFTESDPRKDRQNPYPADANSMSLRHATIFNDFDWRGKRVLDLGCCVGYTGAFALHNGAAFYHGVETYKNLASVAESNLQKYFSSDMWTITKSSIEEFVAGLTEHYDVIIALGVFAAFEEPISILRRIARNATSIFIESTHPRVFSRFNAGHLIDQLAIIELHEGQQISFTDDEVISFIGFRPSSGMFSKVLQASGFQVNNTHERDMIEYSELYNLAGRFIVRATRVNNNEAQFGFVNASSRLLVE